jgi:hypothetical protein
MYAVVGLSSPATIFSKFSSFVEIVVSASPPPGGSAAPTGSPAASETAAPSPS